MTTRRRAPARLCRAGYAATVLLLGATHAAAVPSFAVQTGRPCEACHVGGLGPQLTPFGREFKLRGYTARAVSFNVPLAAFVESSYVATARGQSPPPAAHAGENRNVTVDQISLFVAGGVGEHFGAFVQNTYDGVARTFSWDNLDVRAVTTASLGRSSAVIGVSLNNNPTVQDPYNTLPGWGFPYATSSLAPQPAAAPLIGNLGRTVLGISAYAWIDSRLYAELGAYRSPGAGFLRRAGADPTNPGEIAGTAPYLRLAWQWTLADRNAELGAFALDARLYPAADRTTGLTDHYTDVGVDASWQLFASNRDVITVNGRFTHESQRLNASTALGLATRPRQSLDDVRVDASWYWRDKVGLTAQLFDTLGSADDLLYVGSRRRRPDSSGILLQLDATPFGDGRSGLGPRFNVRVGVQYTAYLTFDGARTNFDELGRSASDNDTLRVFTWIYY